MIKVLNVISDTNIGGAGKTLVNYLKYRDREHFDVSVALPRGSQLKAPLEELGGVVYQVDGMADKSLDLGVIKELKTLIRMVDPDIVHTHGSMSGRIAGRQMGKTVIYTRHSAFPVKKYLKTFPGHQLNGWINGHYADRIIAVSQAAAENLEEGGISPKRISVMMNGVDPMIRWSEEALAPLREKYGLTTEDLVLGIVARIEDYKGHTDILEALKVLRDRGKRPKLLIAGTGGYEEQVKARCKELELEDQVRFLGFVSDVSPVLSLLDVQLNASYMSETSSLSLLEGISMGLPIVASDCCGNPVIVKDGVTGLLFRPRDPQDMADKISALMEDPVRLKAMGQAAEEDYLLRFTGERFAQRLEEIYINTLEEKRHGK